MEGKILCDNDPVRTAQALRFARKHGADWITPCKDPVRLYAVFINGKSLTSTAVRETFERSADDDITAMVFAKDDADKPRLSLVPMQIMFDVAAVREYGTKKYRDKDNWKTVSADRYREAAFRHFLRFLDDPDGVDEESGLPHLSHLACNIAFLCALKKKV